MRAVVFLALVAMAAAATRWHQLHDYTFEAYEAEFFKTYAGEEERSMRRALVEANLERMRRHNADPTKTWKEGVNHLTDRTPAELKSMRGYDKDIGFRRANIQHGLGLSRAVKVGHVDWRDAGIVTSVKDQGMCGSCWTFAAASTLESHAARATGRLATLSEQHILDCVPNPQQCGGTGQCSGGTAELAYATLNGTGLASEWTYPYRSYFGDNFDQCNTTRVQKAADITGYVHLPSNQLAPLLNAITTLGPIAISVEASHWSGYEEGVFDGCNQTNPDIDHAVVLVGYGTDATLGDYWLVRNSWSPAWGEQGYIRVRMTGDEQARCGTDISPGDGSGCAGGPATVQTCGTCGILFDTCYPLVQ